ncbi:hypothetical protein RRG08_018247 [Elysia crispata]|uniref:protein-tyrosine-phosphatase n=1 Tax=Elysia crispata TaxID=231223 RepID=A0AAE0Y793_9GAST|nr:hypothetical protein RRG08_018247 [Elysia crispata]
MVTSSPRTAGISPQNVKKNRYKNIIPYNSTRVLLQRDHKKNQSDYINASYVKGYATDELYIASQAPSDRIINDFVRMIWEQRVDRVVMLTNLTEEGKKKCSRYWPVDGEEEFGDVSARLLTTHVFAEYTIRHLRLSKNGEPTRLVTQFHFTAWPDKSVPESPWGLVDFQQRVMAVPGSGPVLVHCSAGVGRTGTFIGLCNLLKEAEATGKMDFRSVLWKLRQDRMHTIQTAEQYAFLHKMALVGHMTGGTTFKVKDMYQRLAPLESDQDGATSSVSYRQEFEALLKTCDTTTVKFRRSVEEPAESVYQNISSVTTIRSKDRLSNIVPNERYRAVLRAETQHDDTYINAVLVPNLTKDGQDLLTQLPLPSTVTDFWRLVTQFNVGLVVAFDLDSTDSDDTIGEFLPKSETEPFENERYVVESRQKIGNSLVSVVTLTVHQKAVKILDRLNIRNKQTLTLLVCKSKLLDPECALELHKKIKSCKRGGKSRVVYMCRNGADNSGLMCVHSILLDRLEADQCLTVPLVVGSIKAIRPQVIPTYDQYKCLYSVLKLAHESQNVYGNVGDMIKVREGEVIGQLLMISTIFSNTEYIVSRKIHHFRGSRTEQLGISITAVAVVALLATAAAAVETPDALPSTARLVNVGVLFRRVLLFNRDPTLLTVFTVAAANEEDGASHLTRQGVLWKSLADCQLQILNSSEGTTKCNVTVTALVTETTGPLGSLSHPDLAQGTIWKRDFLCDHSRALPKLF